MEQKSNLTGQTFGSLTVIEQESPSRYLCQCECGNEVSVAAHELLRGHKKSCGCRKKKRRSKDITGLRSGMLVAVEPSDQTRRGSYLWRCRCDCGNEILLEPYKITGGVVKSCGCQRGEKLKKDISGQRFGSLTPIRRLDKKRGSNYLWLCRCDCGNEIQTTANALLSGNTKSCGCRKTEALQARAGDFTGHRFGRLTALSPTEERNHGCVVWRCRCDCGKEILVPYNSLLQGNTKSCGCINREKEGPGKYLHYIEGTCVESLRPKGLRKDNTSGYTGVMAYRGKWKAQITFKKKTYNLGVFEHIEDAARVRRQAEDRIFGEFLEWYESQYPERETWRENKSQKSGQATGLENLP